MKKTLVTVVGAGNMGFNHARVLKSIGNLDKIVEKDPSRREYLESIYGDQTVVESIKDSDSDAYVIATPTSTHFNIAKNLLENGKHILVEKPVCMNILEAEELTKIAKLANKVVSVGHVERFNPVVDYLGEWIKNKSLKTIETYRLSSMPQQINDVGVFKDLGIHDVDVVLSLIASKVKSVYAVSSEKNGRDVYTKASITFENGACAFITTSWLSTSKTRKIYVSTDKIDAEMDYLKQSFETKKINIDPGENHFKPQSFHNIEKIELKRMEPLLLQAKNFINAIENSENPKVGIAQATEALKIVECVLESVLKKKVIWL
tara:strand:+ start:636 stop:1592 length:957 start_codon:yes stop_codon:yes gene_type:complete